MISMMHSSAMISCAFALILVFHLSCTSNAFFMFSSTSTTTTRTNFPTTSTSTRPPRYSESGGFSRITSTSTTSNSYSRASISMMVAETEASKPSIPPSSTSSSSSSTTTTSANILVKKAKLKEIQELKAEIETQGADHPINQYLKDGTRAFGVGDPVNFVHAVASRFDSISVLPEFNRKSKTGFILGLPPPEILGGVLRDAGSRGIVVSLDKRSGGATVEEFERFTREQTRARKMMPVPIPVVWNDFIVDDVQILRAGAYGASCVTLYIDFSLESLKGQIALAREHHMEPMVMIRSVEEALAAIAAGARCLCLHTVEETAMIQIREQLPNQTTEGQGDGEGPVDLLYGARLRPESEFSLYAEIDTTWVLRDHKFNFVWPSPEAIYATGMTEIYPSVLAMRSKASRQFLSPRQFLMDRKREGAQEYLGDILY